MTIKLFLATVAALVVTGTPAAASERQPTAIPEKCIFTVPGTKLECGQLDVKLDRSDPQSTARQKLSYVILKSKSKQPAADPVVFLTGGPGSSALYFLNVLAKSAILNTRDLIAIEQRGNGYSEPNLLCDVADASDIASVRVAYRKCFEQVAARKLPLRAYNLDEAARDINDLRTALKIREWNIFGTSYGSFWALRYLAMRPAGVRSVILDSPYPPQADPRDSWVAHLNGLDAVFAACAAETKCNAAYPDLRNQFLGLLAEAAKQPGYTDDLGSQLINFVINTNFETASVMNVPRLLYAYARKDQNAIQAIALLDPYGKPKGFDIRRAASTGLKMNAKCIEDTPFQSLQKDRLVLRGTWPAGVIAAAKLTASDAVGYCGKIWEVAPGSPDFNQPVTSNVPALITVGALDPETPPANGEAMKQTLPNATLAILPDSAHAAIARPSACTIGILERFLARPADKVDIACLAKDQPRFVLPSDPIAMIRIGR